MPSPDYHRVAVFTPAGRRISLNAAETPLLFAADWCPHCRRDLPVIERRLGRLTQERPLIVVFTLFRRPGLAGELTRARAFITREGPGLPWVVEAPDGPSVAAVPTLVFADPSRPGRLNTVIGLPSTVQLRTAVGRIGGDSP